MSLANEGARRERTRAGSGGKRGHLSYLIYAECLCDFRSQLIPGDSRKRSGGDGATSILSAAMKFSVAFDRIRCRIYRCESKVHKYQASLAGLGARRAFSLPRRAASLFGGSPERVFPPRSGFQEATGN